MLEKTKEKFKNNKIEKLVSFLVILVITLIIINRILNGQTSEQKLDPSNTTQLVNSEEKLKENSLEEDLELILTQIQGVGKVDVLITYSQTSSINPLYNENSSSSTTEENSDSNNKTK